MIKKISVMMLYIAAITVMLAFSSMAETTNLIQNGNFETINKATGGVHPWMPAGNSSVSQSWIGNKYVSIANQGYSGNCIKIATRNDDNPWIMQKIPVVEDAVYEISTYLKVTNRTSGYAYFKIEFYDGTKKLGDSQAFALSTGMHDWYKISKTVTAIKDANLMHLYLRLMGNSESYWDNVSCVMTKSPPVVVAEADNIFYYSDWKNGFFTLTENKNYPQIKGSICTVSLKDKNGTSIKTGNAIFKGKYTFEFDVSMLKNIGETYTLEYVCNSDNVAVAQGSKNVYRYNRPSYIKDDNTFEINRKKFFPVIGFHVQPSDYDYCVEAGINIVQYSPGNANDKTILNRLDETHKKGIMAYISLGGLRTAERRKHIVNLVKKHPAVFAYMLSDEPSLHGVDMDEIAETYRMVRNNDTIHPTFIIEAQTYSSRYGDIAKYADIFAVDPYPFGRSKAMDNPAKHVALAKEATQNKKPVMCINEIMTKKWKPTASEIRNMNYQALFAGASGLGYYDVRDVYGYNRGKYEHMWQRESYKGIVTFAENEMSQAFEVFVLQKHKTVASKIEGDVWYKCADTNAGIYCVAINKTFAIQKTKINLPVGANKYICVVNGTVPKNVSREGNRVSVVLNGTEAVAFIMTPEPSVQAHCMSKH